MSAAHTTALGQMYHLLADLPEGVTIRRGTVPVGQRTVVDYPMRAITISHGASFAEFAVGLVLGGVHLDRGPCLVTDTSREDRIVRELTARLMVNPKHLADLDHITDPRELAALLGIDEPTARLGMELARQRPTLEDT